MAKIHSTITPSSSSSLEILSNSFSPCTSYISSGREVFTIWMKSLVLNGSGCTVYNSKGEIIYRVDNYDCKCSEKVYLMDLKGKVLIKILKKKFFFEKWEGYKWNESNLETNTWFKVKRDSRFFQSETSSCEFRNDNGSLMNYQIDGFGKKSSYKIVDNSNGLVVAEIKRKVTNSGMELGNDVFTLVVEPNIDQSLIMGLVLVYTLMNRNM